MTETDNEIIGRVESIVDNIRNLLRDYDPLFVLAACNKIAAQEFVCTDKGPISNVGLEPGLARAGEYLQAVFVSDREIKKGNKRTPTAKEFGDLLSAIKELYNLSLRIQIDVDDLFREELAGLSSKQKKAISTYQIMYGARGKRDFSFQREYYEFLISPHDGLLRHIYGIGAEHVLTGLLDLMRVLMKGWFGYYSFQFDKPICREFFDPTSLPTGSNLESLFDVAKVTGWPESLMRDLAMGIGDGDVFLSGRLAGCPIHDFPIKDRPLFEYNGRFYAFDYYLLSDYFYRSLERALTRQIELRSIVYNWSHIQCEASEAKAAEMLAKIFPREAIYCNNKYRPDGKNTEGENDLLVIFGDAAIIVEVKGGRRWHDSPVAKARAMMRYNFSDIRDAIEQCRKTENYIKTGNPVFYSSDWKQKSGIDVSRCTRHFKLVLAVDGANEIMANVSALDGFVGDQTDVACVSFDDFMVYSDFFSRQPFQFLCYFAERLRATHVESLMTVDELDHLASYLNSPRYVSLARTFENGQPSQIQSIVSVGSFEELAPYFAARNNPSKGIVPSRIFCPGQISGILSVLQEQTPSCAMDVAELLLSLADPEKKKLDAAIEAGLFKLRAENLDCVSFDMNVALRERLTVFVVEEKRSDGGLLKQHISEATHRAFTTDANRSDVLVLRYHGVLDSVEYLVSVKDRMDV